MRLLERHPLLLAAVRDGRVSRSQALALASTITDENVAAWIERAEGLSFLERSAATLNEVAFFLQFRGLAFLQVPLDSLQAPFGDAEIREDQLVFHGLRIARRVNGTRGMRNRFVTKCADNVYEGVGVLVAGDVHERLRSGPGAGNHVGELNRRRHPLSRVVHRRQDVEATVRDLRDPDVDVTLPARRLLGARHELEQGGFAAGGKANERRAQHELPAYHQP